MHNTFTRTRLQITCRSVAVEKSHILGSTQSDHGAATASANTLLLCQLKVATKELRKLGKMAIQCQIYTWSNFVDRDSNTNTIKNSNLQACHIKLCLPCQLLSCLLKAFLLPCSKIMPPSKPCSQSKSVIGKKRTLNE